MGSYLVMVLVVLAMVIVGGGACVADEVEGGVIVFPGEQWEVASAESQGLDSGKLEQAVAHVKSVSGESGVEDMMVVVNGYVVYQGSRVDRMQRIYSCTKSFTSTCFGLLWDDGKVRPGDLVCDYFPALKEHYGGMTFEHVMTLTSGYRGEGKDIYTPGEPAFEPGESLEYGPFADMLAMVFTELAGKSMQELFMERIGGTIGISEDEFAWGVMKEIDGVVINGGGGRDPGGIRTSPRALARFGWLYCNGGVWDGQRLISERYIDYATVARVGVDVPPHKEGAWYKELPGNYGLNWWTNGPRPNGEPHWPHAPEGTFAAQGNKNSICFVVPKWKMVIVRLGEDKVIPVTLYDEMFRLIGEGLEK